MEVKVKLMGALQSKTPEGGRIQLPDGASVADVLQKLDIGNEHVQTVMRNGKMENDRGCVLGDGDELMILAPVGGG